jgi:hypothetical protein
MNTPATSTPDLEGLRKAVMEFRPDLHRLPFINLRQVHDSIAELRKQKASYASIADLLKQHGVKTSRARVAEYGRIVLDGGKSRRRRKRAKITALANPLVPVPSAPVMAVKPAPATTAPATAENVLPPPKESSPFVSRGPRIAKVEQLPPEEAKEFLASLNPGNVPKS